EVNLSALNQVDHFVAVSDAYHEVDGRILATKAGEQRRQKYGGQRAVTADLDCSAQTLPPSDKLLLALLHALQSILRVFDESLSGDRQSDVLFLARKEHDVQFLLQRGYLATERRLSHQTKIGGPAKILRVSSS